MYTVLKRVNFMTISHTIENMVMLSKLENLLKSKGICKIICNKNQMYLQFYKLHSSIHCKIKQIMFYNKLHFEAYQTSMIKRCKEFYCWFDLLILIYPVSNITSMVLITRTITVWLNLRYCLPVINLECIQMEVLMYTASIFIIN